MQQVQRRDPRRPAPVSNGEKTILYSAITKRAGQRRSATCGVKQRDTGRTVANRMNSTGMPTTVGPAKVPALANAIDGTIINALCGASWSVSDVPCA